MSGLRRPRTHRCREPLLLEVVFDAFGRHDEAGSAPYGGSMKATADKKLIRSISDAPILGHLSRLCAHHEHWVPMFSILIFLQWKAFPLWAIASMLVAALALVIWSSVGYPGHRHFAGTIAHLHGRLHWFDADTITWFPKDQLAELRARLAERDVVVHELDGTTISSLAALVTELHRRFGKRAGPKDPAANARVDPGRHGDAARRHTRAVVARLRHLRAAGPRRIRPVHGAMDEHGCAVDAARAAVRRAPAAEGRRAGCRTLRARRSGTGNDRRLVGATPG